MMGAGSGPSTSRPERLFSMNHAARSAEEEIIALSLDKFRWKTSRRFDLVEALFDDDLHFVHITGHVSSKREWIEELRSGRFVYNRIEPRGASVAVEGDRATLRGKAVFTVTRGAHRGQYRLAFTEVYVRKPAGWRLVELLTSTY
ncbi:DUF4440 domain-containing protein [Rhizobium leguminosarum bv. viciae]|nr:DUF4440 domain-containing protein [Rhizobium leguminosarum bv. viciae]